MSERDLREQVRSLAQVYGWRMYFTQNAFRSPKGFPDLVLVRPPRLIFAELKREDGRTTSDQDDWLADLGAIARVVESDMIAAREAGPSHVEVFIWRPSDVEDIARVLSGKGGADAPRESGGEMR